MNEAIDREDLRRVLGELRGNTMVWFEMTDEQLREEYALRYDMISVLMGSEAPPNLSRDYMLSGIILLSIGHIETIYDLDYWVS